MEWYPRYYELYAADTLGLTLAEHGAYNLLIDQYMRARRPLPDDDRQLAAILRVGLPEWLAVASVVRAFFKPKNGLLAHKKCECELDKQDLRSKLRSEIAKKGAAVRWNNNNDLNASSMPTAKLMHASVHATGQDKTRHKKERIPPTAVVKPAFDASAAVAAWNLMASASGLAQVQRLTQGRKAKLRQRLADCGGEEGWSTALAKVAASPFLRGESERGWKADFDFLLQERSFTKLMEGGYDRKSNGHGGIDGSTRARRAAILAGLSGELVGVGNDPASGD